jgi:hypothetical protein
MCHLRQVEGIWRWQVSGISRWQWLDTGLRIKKIAQRLMGDTGKGLPERLRSLFGV